MTIEELQIELQNNPRSLNFVRLADMYLAENMVDAAFQLLERSLKYHPNSISGHLLIGKIFVLRSDFDKALEHLNFCVQKAPTNWQALLTRAELHLKTQKPKPALADFKSVLLHNPQNPIARKMVAKLEVISADDYESDVFEIKTIQDLPSPTAPVDRNPAASYDPVKDQKRERILSLVDAFTVRKDYVKALQLLKECHTEFGDHFEIQTRLLRLSQYETAEKIRPKAQQAQIHYRQQQILEKKKNALELLLRRIQELQPS